MTLNENPIAKHTTTRNRNRGALLRKGLTLGAGGLAALLALGCGQTMDDEGSEVRSVTQLTVGVLGSTEPVQVINTLDELRNMTLSGNYRLGSDIDASATESTPFTPIGNPLVPFTGTFDGDGHTIDNLHISAGTYQGNYTGLFAAASEAVITNVGLTDVEVSGRTATGALVGSLINSTLTDCYVTGTVTADWNATAVGMVVGRMGGGTNVTRCSVVGTLAGAGSLIGGFVGEVDAPGNDSQTQKAYLSEVFTDVRVGSDKNWGNVTAGGLAGSTLGADIININVVGPVSGREAVGGIVGFVTNSREDSYTGVLHQTLFRGNVTDHASSVDRAGIIGGSDGEFARCTANAWDEGADNGTPATIPHGDLGCQAGYPTETLVAPHPAPDKLIDPFYNGMFVTQELIDMGYFDQCKLGSGSDGDWGFGTCDTDVIWYLNSDDEHITLARVPIPEEQPLKPDSLGECTEASAIDLGTVNKTQTVPADACLKVTQYPGQWVNFVVLQAQNNGNIYPLAYEYQTCEGNGTDQLNNNWDQKNLPADPSCVTLIQLGGSPYDEFSVSWWAGG